MTFTGCRVPVGFKGKGESIVSPRYSYLPDTVDLRGVRGKP